MLSEVSLQELQLQHTAVLRRRVSHEGLGAFFATAFDEVVQTLVTQEAVASGPPFARYHALQGGDWDVEAGVPVQAPIRAAGEVHSSSLPAGTAAHVLHTGPFDDLGRAHEALSAWVQANGFRPYGEAWETYLDGPEVPEPRTAIYQPCVAAT